MTQENETLKKVKEYYGEILKSASDLKTSACCTTESLPSYLREIAKSLPTEIQEKFYGCGSPIPFCLEGKTVLDLGCGTGRDAYLLSQLVGAQGQVIGVDMTESQLEVARRHLDEHTKKLGDSQPNLKFLSGYIEDLEGLGIANHSIDAVISNCVINLSPNKPRVFSEIFRVLKPGGELFFSDVFTGRRVPPDMAKDPVLLGECLGGSLYIEDFRRLLAQSGCLDARVVSKTPLTLNSPEIEKKVGRIDFYSMTIRAFKLQLEDRCEDYGQVAFYLGTIPESPHFFKLDDHHLFEKDRAFPVCGNTADMLIQTRYAPHFKVIGDKTNHFGLFDCAPPSSSVEGNNTSTSGACC